MKIPLPLPENPDIYSVGFDKNLYRLEPEEKVVTPTAYDQFKQISPSLLTSGSLVGDVVLAGGNLKTADFSSTASTGWQFLATGYLEANSGVFRGDLSIGSGDNIILADPDGDTWRLGIGDADISEAPFRIDKNGASYATSFKTIENFTAGEDINVGNVVCLKNSHGSALITTAAYVADTNPNTNYGSEQQLYIGLSGATTYYSFMKIPLDTIPSNFQKAELVMYLTSFQSEILLVEMASADAATPWTEANLTWNNKPESFFDSDDPGGQYSFTIVNEASSIIDITQMMKLWKRSLIPDYGLRLRIGSPSSAPQFASDDNADTSKRPFIRWLTYDESDGKVYKANASDYNLSHMVLGVATTTVVADSTLPIQRTGKSTNVNAGVGGKRYLDVTAGSCNVATPAGLPRAVMVGVGTTTSELYIDIRDENLFIETSGPFNIMASDTRQTVVVHPDASKAVIDYRMNRGTAYEDMGNFTIDIFGDTFVGRKRAISTTATKESSFDWQSTSQYIVIDSQSGASGGADYLTYTIHFYT